MVQTTMGAQIARVGDILRVRRATMSDLVNGRASFSPEMALRIEKTFGISLDMLFRMQALFDSYRTRRRAHQLDVEPFDAPG